MLIRSALVAATVVLALSAGPVGAADLGGYVGSDDLHEDRDAYNTRPYADDYRSRPRRRNRERYQSRRRDYGPRRTAAFNRVRDDLEDAGYSRIDYRDERRDRYGERIYALTACQNGVRYRMHVTAACEVALKRRAGYCRSNAYY